MRIAILAALVLVSSTAMAQYVTVYHDRLEFAAQGHILMNWDFADMPRDAFTMVEQPYTTHDVTYASEHDLYVIGADVYGTLDNLIGTGTASPFQGDLNPEPGYEMLGWDMTDIGHFGANFPIHCYTSAGAWEDLVYAPSEPGYSFIGFVAHPGITINGFLVSGFGAYRPAITNVTLGIRANTGVPVGPTDGRPAATWSALKALF